jgi:hypothetical protein
MHKYLIIDDPPLLLVPEHRNSESAFVFVVGFKIYLPEMCKALMMRIRYGVFARDVLVGLCESPSWEIYGEHVSEDIACVD